MAWGRWPPALPSPLARRWAAAWPCLTSSLLISFKLRRAAISCSRAGSEAALALQRAKSRMGSSEPYKQKPCHAAALSACAPVCGWRWAGR